MFIKIKKNSLFLISIISIFPALNAGEINSWDCNDLEGAKVISSTGAYLGDLGPTWSTNSIFNDYSPYASTWHQDSIFNEYSEYGNSYSDSSVFNESASNPPKIINEGAVVGYLSIGPSWESERYSPYDIKYTCDWD